MTRDVNRLKLVLAETTECLGVDVQELISKKKKNEQ